MAAPAREHPLQGAVNIVKGELDPQGDFMKSIVEEIWGKAPPFSAKLTRDERQKFYSFVLANPAMAHDLEEKIGPDRFAAVQKQYGPPEPVEEQPNG